MSEAQPNRRLVDVHSITSHDSPISTAVVTLDADLIERAKKFVPWLMDQAVQDITQLDWSCSWYSYIESLEDADQAEEVGVDIAEVVFTEEGVQWQCAPDESSYVRTQVIPWSDLGLDFGSAKMPAAPSPTEPAATPAIDTAAPGVESCIVGCADANGSRTLIEVEVEATEAQRAEGKHYQLASDQAYARGYEEVSFVMDAAERRNCELLNRPIAAFGDALVPLAQVGIQGFSKQDINLLETQASADPDFGPQTLHGVVSSDIGDGFFVRLRVSQASLASAVVAWREAGLSEYAAGVFSRAAMQGLYYLQIDPFFDDIVIEKAG